MVFGVIAGSESEAVDIIMPYAAAGAVLAVTVSELCALVCLLVRKKSAKGLLIHLRAIPRQTGWQ